jgi:hypothetical protein
MKRTWLEFGAVVSLIVVTGGCWNPFADQSVVLDVTELAAPAGISAGSKLSVALKVVTGGCRRFDRIVEADRSASSATLTAWGTDGSKGRNDVLCPTDIRFESRTYELDPPFANPFTINVPRERLSPLQVTVQIQ